MYCESARRTAHNRAAMKPTIALFVLALTLLMPTAGGAESEWAGSPPPLDFGLRFTAEPSTTAPYPWIRSTDSPELEQTWLASGVNTSQLSGVSGGVATGMTTALGTAATSER